MVTFINYDVIKLIFAEQFQGFAHSNIGCKHKVRIILLTGSTIDAVGNVATEYFLKCLQ